MVQINLARREINCKIVYFGCGLGGKTTNIEVVHQLAGQDSRGELTSIATESDRTLFFDFMPLDIGEVSGMRVKFQLYTVPGQVYYNSTRKLVLRGADAVIFIADSQATKCDENLASLENLRECLAEQGRSLDEMPHVIQFNKADVTDRLSEEAMERELNLHGAPTFCAVASTGIGVLETFKAMAEILLDRVRDSVAQSNTSADMLPPSSEGPPPPLSRRERLAGGLPTPSKGAVPLAASYAPHTVEQRSLDTSTTGAAVMECAPPSPNSEPAPPRHSPNHRSRSSVGTSSGLILSASRRTAPKSSSIGYLIVGAAIGIVGAAAFLVFFLL